MPTLSLCMIVKDERHNLERSLAPLMPFVSEAVVVDTGSTDGTIAAAAALGARVFSFTWQDDFSLARNFSLAQARGDWILWLDADNCLEPADAAALLAWVDRADEAILWAWELVEPGGGRLLQKRLFPRRPDIFFRYRVHEQLCHPPDLPQVVTAIRIHHWGYADRRARRAKAKRNLALLLRELADRPDDFYVHYHLGRHYLLNGEVAAAWLHLNQAAQPEVARQNPEIARHARLLAALCRERLDGLAPAREDLASLTAAFPDYGLAWYHLGLNQFRAGELGPASGSLARFLALGSGHLLLDQPEERLRLTALLTRTQSLRRLGQGLEAGRMLEAARQLYPQEATVWLEIAAWAREQGEDREQRRALNTCLKLRPACRTAARMLQAMAGGPEHVGA